MPFKTLPPDEGFSVDSRPPGIDSIALAACNATFSKSTIERVIKENHRSSSKYEDLRADIEEYNISYSPRFTDPVYEAVFESVRSEFTPPELLTPLTMGAVCAYTTVPKDKAPGLPWSKRGFKTKKDVMTNAEAMKEIRSEWLLIGKGYRSILPDTQVFYRAQICSRDKNKIRAVWGYPMTVFMEEARYVYPYLDFLKKRKDDYPLAYGVEMARGGMGYIHDAYMKHKPRFVSMVDWSRFDKTIPAWLLRDAFSIIFNSFHKDRVQSTDDVFPVNPDITENRIKKVIRYFINTPFRLSDGTRYQKDGGVPSGSGFTNIIDSIVNAIVTRYVYYHTCGELPKFDIYMGDDSVVMTDSHPSLDQIASVAEKWFGMKINVDKSFVTTRPECIMFLGYHNNSGRPLRNHDFLIASWIYPERYQLPDPVFTAVRGVGQLWSTMNSGMATYWLRAIEWIVNTYELQPNWLENHLAMYPLRLKFLNLHGIQPTDVYLPKTDSAGLIPDVEPPVRPSNRQPGNRALSVKELYVRSQSIKMYTDYTSDDDT